MSKFARKLHKTRNESLFMGQHNLMRREKRGAI